MKNKQNKNQDLEGQEEIFSVTQKVLILEIITQY